MAYSDVQVTFEFGHRAAIRTKLTPEGYTHDWEVFVRGADGADISHFVEKVVFYLHETFPKPKRVIKEPPYSVKESGYAGFNLLIDIYFKNKDEPKKFKHNYDLNLQSTGPAIVKALREKYVFTNPSGDFRKKLLKGGGIGIDAPVNDKAFGDATGKSQKSSSSSHLKPPPEVAKKHKKEPEMKPTSQFSELFGDPIKKTKVSPDPKKHLATPSTSKPSTSSGGGKGPIVKPGSSSEKTSLNDKVKSVTPKEEKKEDKKRDKSSSKESSDKRMAKPSSPLTTVKVKEEIKVKEEPAEKKKKDKKYKDEKETKIKYPLVEKPSSDKLDKLVKDKETKKSPKPTSSLSLLEEKMRHREPEKQHKSKHKKKDKEKKEKKSEGKDKKREPKARDEAKFKEPEPHSPSPPAPTKVNIDKPSPSSQREKPVKNPLSTLFAQLSDEDNSDSNNSMSGDEDMEFPMTRVKSEEPPPKRDTGPKKREVDKKSKKDEEKKRKRKRSTDSDEEVEPPVSKKDSSLNSQDMLPPPPLPINNSRDEFSDITPEYESELRELQRKIMNLDDDHELQRLVSLITETGKYEVTKKTFDFDLCTLDRSTVTRLQDFFRAL